MSEKWNIENIEQVKDWELYVIISEGLSRNNNRSKAANRGTEAIKELKKRGKWE